METKWHTLVIGIPGHAPIVVRYSHKKDLTEKIRDLIIEYMTDCLPPTDEEAVRYAMEECKVTYEILDNVSGLNL